MSARTSLLVVVIAVAAVACKPSPDTVDLASTTHPSVAAEGRATVVEGDVMIVEAKPLDDDYDQMDLCVTASSTAPESFSVERVKNKCRFFIVSGKNVGPGSVTFRARDGESTLAVEVTPP